MNYLAVMVSKFVKQVVREWCPSTIGMGPLLPTMTDSLNAPGQEVLYEQYQMVSLYPSARAKNKKGPKPGEHVQLFRMKRDRNKGFYSEKCQLEAFIALCFERVGCLVPRDVLLPLHNIGARTERRVQRTLPFRPYFLGTKLFVGHGGGGGECAGECADWCFCAHALV